MKPPPRKALLPPPRRPVEKKSEPQEHLFYMPESWEREWKGMPGYVQSDLEPHKRLQVNFATIDDLMAFAKHIGQQVTMKTVSIWYPKVEFDKVSELRWVDGNGSGGPKYHEWKKKGSKDYYDCPRKLDPDTEKKVLAYEDFMHLLEKQ